MADKRKDVDKEEFKLKEEIDSIHDENLPFTSLESLCTVYVQCSPNLNIVRISSKMSRLHVYQLDTKTVNF